MVDLRCWSSGNDHIHHIFHGKSFIKRLNSFQCTSPLHLLLQFFLSDEDSYHNCRISLFRILHQNNSVKFFSGKHHFLQTQPFHYQLCSHFSFTKRFIAHQMFQLCNIFMRIIKNAFPFHAITTRTASFLVIIFNTFWNIIMNYITGYLVYQFPFQMQ